MKLCVRINPQVTKTLIGINGIEIHKHITFVSYVPEDGQKFDVYK